MFTSEQQAGRQTALCSPGPESHVPKRIGYCLGNPLHGNRIWEINFLKWPCEANINDPWIKFHLVEQFRHHKYNGVLIEKSGCKNINRVWIYKASFGCDNSDSKHYESDLSSRESGWENYICFEKGEAMWQTETFLSLGEGTQMHTHTHAHPRTNTLTHLRANA